MRLGDFGAKLRAGGSPMSKDSAYLPAAAPGAVAVRGAIVLSANAGAHHSRRPAPVGGPWMAELTIKSGLTSPYGASPPGVRGNGHREPAVPVEGFTVPWWMIALAAGALLVTLLVLLLRKLGRPRAGVPFVAPRRGRTLEP